MKNVAIILAAGTGSRMGEGCPKQFLRLNGRTVVEYSVDAFERCNAIDEIAVVMHPDHMQRMLQISKVNNWTKLQHILAGGKERYLSTTAAIKAYSSYGECNLLFHDAARPLVSDRIICDVADALHTYNAVGVAVPMTDTVFITEGDTVRSIPDRRKLQRAQTPQGFRLSTIQQAYDIALRDPDFVSTDDCGTVLRYLPNITIYIVRGDERNVKLTYKEDLPLIEQILKKGDYQ